MLPGYSTTMQYFRPI